MSLRALSTQATPAPSTTRRRLVRSSLMAGVIAALPFAHVVAKAQSDPSASPAGSNAEVIAQGVSALPAGQIAWRLVQDTAVPIGGAIFEERALGFAVAAEDALLLTDEADGSRARLAPGEAAFTLGGITQMRESLGNAASPYFRIALVGADEASNPNGDNLIHAGEPFESPADDRDIDLVAVRLEAGETASVPSEHPVLVVVLDGEASLGDLELAAGDAATIDGSVELEAEKDGTRILVAAIGASISGGQTGAAVSTPAASVQTTPAADNPSSGVGKIVVLTELCPEGITPEQAADTSAGDACFAGAPVDNLPITITALSENATWTVYPSGGTAYIPDLAPGPYYITFGSPDGLGATVGVCGGQDGSSDLPVISLENQVELELPADREYLCVTRTTQFYDADNGATDYNSGSIAATFYVCPDGMTVDTVDPAQCTLIADGSFDVGFQEVGAYSLSDASLHGGTYVWEGLPIGDDVNSGLIYSLAVNAYPAGYTAFGISNNGGPIFAPHAGGVIPTVDNPNIYLDVYFFTA